MWSLFSRDPATSFPYEIGEAVQPKEERSIFTLHYAKKKICGTPVSAFLCLGAVHNNAELELARTAVKRLRTLKHPCILDYIDSLESEKAVYLITSPVSPLLSWLMDCQLSEQHKLNVAGWGLRQVLKAINFLNTDGSLEHCNVCSSSVFVTPGGEWKLFGVEYCRPTTDSSQHHHPPPNRLPPSLAVYDAPEKANDTRRMEMVAWSGDAWGIGCLMWEVFTVAPLMQSGALRNTSKFPAKVLPLYKALLLERPAQRPDAATVLKQLSTPGHFLDNDLLHTVDFLDNIHIKQDTEKQRFFSELTDRLDNIPDFIVKNKILPATLSAHQFSSVGSVVLAPLFKMSKLLSEPEYQSQVLPCVVRLFSSSDRATRLQLLQQMQHLIVHMDHTTVNDKVFPELATGFLDTNPTIREHTVKSVLHLAPKLNKHNLNIEVLKHFARLQARDEQGGIRTNCTVCLGKVACNLAATTRQKCLISAFTRALRDPFPPARVAGIMALAATQHYYPLDQVALRILPALCPLAMDPEKTVRDAVFRVIKGFLGKLEKLSEDPSLKEEMESEVSAASTGALVGGAASGWAGWAVGTLTSKFYKSSISGVGLAHQNHQTPPTDGSLDAKRAPIGADPKVRAPLAAASKHQLMSSSSSSGSQSNATQSFSASVDSNTVAEEGEGWKDEDDDAWKPIEDSPAETSPAGGGWDDAEEDWGNLEQCAEEASAPLSLPVETQRWEAGSSGSSLASVPRSARSSTNSAADTAAPAEDGIGWSGGSSVKPATAFKWSSSGANPDSDDFFAAIATDKVASSGGAAANDWGSSWDDTGASNSAALSSDCREQKRLERQRQIEAKRAAKGPMKLGTRKT